MAELADEVRRVVESLLVNLKPVAVKNPDKILSAADVNQVLDLPKKAYPDSPTIKGMRGFERVAKAADLVQRLSALNGAIVASRAGGPSC